MESASMHSRSTVASSLLALALAAAGCGVAGPARPSKEAVTALLQQEANQLKTDGEKLDPIVGVTATWTVAGIDVTERPNDAEKPWAGTIRFKVRSDAKDTGGTVKTEEFEKSYEYIYTTTVNRWIYQMKP
jgi:hypothetical protein